MGSHRLWPPDTPTRPLDVDAWAAAYAYPADPPRGWWMRANMITTADGAAVAEDGLTRGISSDTDRDLLALLRALADVVVVGATTAVSEGYGPDPVRPEYAYLRSGRPETPPMAVVSNRLDLDLDSPLFSFAATPTVLLTVADAPSDRLRAARNSPGVDLAIVGRDRVDPAAAVAALVSRGHRQLLCEGGPHWLASVVAAGVLDELCLTISPLLAGGDPCRILAPTALPGGLELTLDGVCTDGACLFLRYLLEPNTSARSNETGSVNWA